MLIPPPLFYVAAFGLGLLIERWVPSPSHFLYAEGGVIAKLVTIAAAVTIAIGAVLGPFNAMRFLFRRTSLNPNKQATVFLTRGSYGLSRNPMYLGLFLIYSGIAILKGTGWPFATIVIPFLLLDRIVVPFEERQMAERFGSPYRDYCRRVGRWLTLRAPAQREGP
jgi:protein-S-isoprenylcysteine O-methyltransferase Ste14